jgi:hypothetical protein
MWLECTEFLFDCFPGKGKIIQRINDFPVTRNAVKDDILKIKQTTFLCICPDKNTDFKQLASLAVSARLLSGDGISEC